MAYSYNKRSFNISDSAGQAANQMIASAQRQATTLVQNAQQTMNSLANFTVTLPPPPVIPPIVRASSSAGGGVGHGRADDSQDINVDIPEMPPPPPTNTSSIAVTIPTFNKSVVISPPAAPAALVPDATPVRPGIDRAIALPDAPALSIPVSPVLDDILVPTFDFPTLPTFDDAAPQFTEAKPNVAMQWNEPEYFSPVLDDLRAKIRAIFAGGTGLPAAVEQALFDKAASREEAQVVKNTQEAFDTFARRGFAMPPGMLVAQVNAAREEGQLRVNAINRETFIEAAKWQLENLKMAVEQGVAAENMMIQLHNNAVNRGFEAIKAVLDGNIALYNASVSLFNARQNAFQVAAGVYKTKIDAELSRIEVYKAEIEGVRVRGERNEQRVREYTARLQAVSQQVEIYKAQMQGAQVEADVTKSIIEAYKTDVDAYAAKLQAEKVRFEAYESQVRGELAKAQILDIDARVFATQMQGAEIGANIKAKEVEAEIAAMNAQTQRFIAELERSKVEIQEASERVRAKLGYMGAQTQALAVDNDAKRAEREADIRIGEQQLQATIEAAKMAVAQYQATASTAVEQARLRVTAIQGASQAASTLAAGAMAAIHVGATVSNSQNVGFGVSYSESGSEQTQTIIKPATAK